jgi:integrase
LGEALSAVDNWSQRLSPSTSRVNRYFLGKWIDWLRANGGRFSAYTPDDLISYQRSADNGSRYDLLDLIQRYVQGLPGRYSSKEKEYATLRSFFVHNRAELPRDPSFTLRAEVPRVVGTLTIEELRDLILSANTLYRAIFLSMFQGGLDLSGLEYWNENGWARLNEDLKADPETVRIDLPGRKRSKNKVSFYTFIGPDAIRAIRDYLPKRPKGSSAIFCDQFGGPVKKGSVRFYWDSHLRKLGVIGSGKSKSSRYGKGRHEMRDIFRTQWAKSGAASDVAEFCMQHEIDELGYNKIFNDLPYMVKEYKKALPFIQILSSSRAFGQVSEDEIEVLRAQNAKLTKEVDALKNKPETFRAEFEELRAEVARNMALTNSLIRALSEREKRPEN